jgi:hypothetical protein
MREKPSRVVKCDMCGFGTFMNVKLDFIWKYKLPKGWHSIDANNFFEDKDMDYCPDCVKKMRSGGK